MAKIYFNPKEQEIMDVLKDLAWHCVWSEVKQKDDRARLTAIGRKLAERGWMIKSEPCTIHNHDSRILMRRIVKLTTKSTQEAMEEYFNNLPTLV